MGIVVIWGNAFTLILRFFRHEVVGCAYDFRLILEIFVIL